MRDGRRMALDIGKARIGIAVCDREGILASPLQAISRASNISDTVNSILPALTEYEVIELYVGEPVSLKGHETESTHDARTVALEIAAHTSVPVRLVDERLTTVSAAMKLRSAGYNSRSSKDVIDSASAVEIPEIALAIEKNTGVAPGQLVGDSVGA